MLLQVLNYAQHNVNMSEALLLKHQACYVAVDYDEECELPSKCCEQTYTLPDDTPIVLCKERFIPTEAIFNPQLMGMYVVGGGTRIGSNSQRPSSTYNLWVCMLLGGGGQG